MVSFLGIVHCYGMLIPMQTGLGIPVIIALKVRFVFIFVQTWFKELL